MNPVHWSQIVPVAVLDRFGELWREARQLGRKPRSLLVGAERARLDQVEAELDDLVESIVAVMPLEGMPGLVAGAVEAVRDTRDLQRYYRRTLCPTIRRELPGVERATDDEVGSLADVVGIFAPAAGEGGAP